MRSIIAISLAGTIIVTTWCAWTFFSSPWLTWYTQAPHESQIHINSSQIAVTPELRDTFRTIALSEQGNTSRLIQHLTSFDRTAIQNTLRIALQHPRLLHPLAISYLQTADFPDGIYVVVSHRRGVVLAGTAPTIDQALEATQVLPTPTSQPNTLTMPGYILRSIPTLAIKALNTDIVRRLQLPLTTPDILEYMSQFDIAYISLPDTDNVALAVSGASESFAASALHWAQEEERRTRPQKRIFTLPDGSSGTETIPGDAIPVFGPQLDTCYRPVDTRAHYTVCETHPLGMIYTSHTPTTPTLSADLWSVDLGHSALEHLCTNSPPAIAQYACSSNRLLMQGTDAIATINLVLAPKEQ